MNNDNAYAVITGATSGIGLEFARLFAADAVNLVLVARGKAELEQVSKELREGFNIDVRILSLDLTVLANAETLHGYTKSEQLNVN